MTPQRIQRKRTPGWTMPEGAVYVGRPSKWENRNAVIMDGTGLWGVRPFGHATVDIGTLRLAKGDAAAIAVQFYRHDVAMSIPLIESELAGKDLACWCPLDQPCHADVLLELANGPTA